MSDWGFKSAVELAGMIQAKEVGCLELLEYFLGRVERFNPALNAIVVLDADRARARAQEADEALARVRIGDRFTGCP